ncbi:glycosyl transferase [Candidatus Nitromaritima sp. SCGC AAA799-A02]|nr:glycosyl transferase [Candidatus Nitromaritima sp. SCGC AAA799-A02]
MTDSTAFSIIIPFKTWSPDLDECLHHIRKLSLRGYEVILLPDGPLTLPSEHGDLPVTVIPTGPVNPALKRDRGADKAKGTYLAFIDDDAYPRPDWLEVAWNVLNSRDDVAAIGGPAMTPKSDPFWARVSGAVYLSRFSGGFPERYVPCQPARLVDDWPTVNLIVRKSVFQEVEGFDSNFWPGEDTLFCLKILQKTEKKILYVPELMVWHHRRSQLPKHLRQVGNYGLHRGYFAKIFPQTSRQIKYFIPTLWVAFVLTGPIMAVSIPWAGMLYLAGWTLYMAVLLLSWSDIQRHETPLVTLGTAPFIILTHFWYGLKFVQGLATSKLKSSLGR